MESESKQKIPLNVLRHSNVTASSLQRRWAQSLAAGQLAPGLLYRTPTQSALWQKVHAAHAPVYQDTTVAELYRRVAERLQRENFGTRFNRIIALGCGTGVKECALSAAWSGRAIQWTAVDISEDLVRAAARHAGTCHPEWSLGAMAVDFIALTEHDPWLKTGMDHEQDQEQKPTKQQAAGRDFVFLLGIIANQDPVQLLHQLEHWTAAGDVVAVGVNLLPDDEPATRNHIRTQYENPATIRWLQEALDLLRGSPELPESAAPEGVASNAALRWQWQSSAQGWGHQLKANAVFQTETLLRCGDVERIMCAGEALTVFQTNRIIADRINRLCQGMRFEVLWQEVSDCKEEGVMLLLRTG